ncbi:hypothetical protein HBI23_251980 [Parastagonospora nodorum]|nr:hypothetical protein HBI23_251980 [Parastagonospora nodorum]
MRTFGGDVFRICSCSCQRRSWSMKKSKYVGTTMRPGSLASKAAWSAGHSFGRQHRHRGRVSSSASLRLRAHFPRRKFGTMGYGSVAASSSYAPHHCVAVPLALGGTHL